MSATSHCPKRGEHSFLIPLHGGKGGPLRCPLCVGKWNAKHGRRRRAGRVVIRAIDAFLEAGGSYNDIDKLKLSVGCGGTVLDRLYLDPLGYMDGIARLDGADADLTSELLADTLRLTHPDCHPPERKALAHHVTQGLLALQPFVFPALKPEPEPKPTEPPIMDSWYGADAIAKSVLAEKFDKEPLRLPYPCADCRSAIPADYCDACRAEWEKRQHEEHEKETAKQRAAYKRRRDRTLARRPKRQCESCGTEFKSKRNDARFCCNTCRQRAHRKALVTDKTTTSCGTITNRDSLERGILALLAKHRAIFLNDFLPEQRTRAQYQALRLAASRLEAAGKIGSWTYAWRDWDDEPGTRVLLKLGYEPTELDSKKIYRLKPNEHLIAA
jgi:hypothetical protein